MTIEGELAVTLVCERARVREVAIHSTRPLAAAQVLVGRTAADAAAMVPLLYSVCAHAQGAAAAAALESAEGHVAGTSVQAARALAITLETIQETLRQLLLDLPQALGFEPDVAALTAARRAIAPALAAHRGAAAVMAGWLPTPEESVAPELAAALHVVAERSVFGERAADFHALADAAALRAWTRRAGTAPAVALRAIVDRASGLGTSDVALLATGGRDALAAAVLAPLAADPGFARAPHWEGEARETGALARIAGHPALADWCAREGRGVAARLFARLVELAGMLDALATQQPLASWSLHAGAGVAAVETARGLLLHRAEVGNGRVTRYAILAPTEWNFHPAGPLARGLAQLPADDEAGLERAAHLVVRSLDPCVACRVEIGHA